MNCEVIVACQSLTVLSSLFYTGELWSTNSLELHVSLDQLKCTFWGYHISALRGCCAMRFLHALDIDQCYLAHTQLGNWDGVPQKFLIVNIKRLA